MYCKCRLGGCVEVDNEPLHLPSEAVRNLNDGSPARARTRDPMINSHLLYQLSYRGIEDAYTK